MTTEVGTYGAWTLSCVNFSGCVGHETLHYCVLFTSRVRFGLGLDLVCGWLVVMHTYLYEISVVTVTLPVDSGLLVHLPGNSGGN